MSAIRRRRLALPRDEASAAPRAGGPYRPAAIAAEDVQDGAGAGAEQVDNERAVGIQAGALAHAGFEEMVHVEG